LNEHFHSDEQAYEILQQDRFVDVNERHMLMETKTTTLHEAASANQHEIIEKLLECKASIDLKDGLGPPSSFLTSLSQHLIANILH